jgi:hypothetical protein
MLLEDHLMNIRDGPQDDPSWIPAPTCCNHGLTIFREDKVWTGRGEEETRMKPGHWQQDRSGANLVYTCNAYTTTRARRVRVHFVTVGVSPKLVLHQYR